MNYNAFLQLTGFKIVGGQSLSSERMQLRRVRHFFLTFNFDLPWATGPGWIVSHLKCRIKEQFNLAQKRVQQYFQGILSPLKRPLFHVVLGVCHQIFICTVCENECHAPNKEQYGNEVTLREQNLFLKCCQSFELKRGAKSLAVKNGDLKENSANRPTVQSMRAGQVRYPDNWIILKV